MSHRKPYTCPRCGYNSRKKYNMYIHLTNLRKPCPATEQDIEITQEVKDYILINRIYHTPEQPQQTIYNYINNNQQINNIIADMDAIQNLEAYFQSNNSPKPSCLQHMIEL